MGDADDVRRALDDVERLYTTNLADHGLTSASVGWPDADAQRLRFDKLAHLIELDRPQAPVTVTDWGCGWGAMFDYLDERPDLELAGYHGYDISEDMLKAAADHVADPRAHWHHGGGVNQEADYSFVSGTFNVRMGVTDEAWMAWITERLDELWAASRRGMAFNLLTSYVDWRKDDLFYAPASAFFDLCVQRFSRRVALLHDYPLYEWTMVVRRED